MSKRVAAVANPKKLKELRQDSQQGRVESSEKTHMWMLIAMAYLCGYCENS